VPALVAHFVDKYARENTKNVTGVSPEALQALMDYDWPGNVRELENVIERGVVLTTGTQIGRELIPDHVRTAPSFHVPHLTVPPEGISLRDVIANFERRLIESTLESTAGVQKEAARLLGLKPTTLNEMIKRHNILLPRERDRARGKDPRTRPAEKITPLTGAPVKEATTSGRNGTRRGRRSRSSTPALRTSVTFDTANEMVASRSRRRRILYRDEGSRKGGAAARLETRWLPRLARRAFHLPVIIHTRQRQRQDRRLPFNDGAHKGQIYLHEGRKRARAARRVFRREAVYGWPSWNQGISFERRPPSEIKTISKSNTNLLMEAARRLTSGACCQKKIPSVEMIPEFVVQESPGRARSTSTPASG
jgi:DNA-binding protein Fis